MSDPPSLRAESLLVDRMGTGIDYIPRERPGTEVVPTASGLRL